MKKVIIVTFFCLSLLGFNSFAQHSGSGRSYGNTLNLGLGIGGY